MERVPTLIFHCSTYLYNYIDLNLTVLAEAVSQKELMLLVGLLEGV